MDGATQEIPTRWGRWLLGILFGLFGLGFVAIVVYAAAAEPAGGASSNAIASFLKTVAICLAIAAASFLVGGGTGFLFGIPRSRSQGDSPANQGQTTEADRRNYFDNTNLEQVSDWLTKIIIGVGLTQLLRIPAKLAELAAFLAKGLGKQTGAEVFSLGLVIQFLLLGFLCGYLATTWYLPVALEWFLRYRTQIAEAERKLSSAALPLDAASTLRAMVHQMSASALSAADLVAQQPFDPSWPADRKLAWARAAVAKKNFADAARAYEQVVTAAVPKPMQCNALKECTFISLYLPAPGGYTRAIECGTRFLRECSSSGKDAATVKAYLACAYAQKYRDQFEHPNEPGAAEAEKLARDRCLAFLREAISEDPGWKAPLRENWLGTDPEENDLDVFLNDSDFKQLFS